METKSCRECGKNKPVGEFYPLKRGGKYWSSYCKPCSAKKNRQWRSKNKPRHDRRKAKYFATTVGRARRLFLSAKARARKAGVPITLNPDWIEERLVTGVCEVTGIGFDLSTGGGRGPFSPSLDRTDPEGGYTPDNVKVVIWMHNMVRSNWGNAPLKTYIKSFLTRKT